MKLARSIYMCVAGAGLSNWNKGTIGLLIDSPAKHGPGIRICYHLGL
jgi:hypothetical protein